MTEREKELEAALRECADDLEAWVEDYYALTKDYPSEQRRYDRDIAPVRRARAALSDRPDGEGTQNAD